jgi:hypothetical protein
VVALRRLGLLGILALAVLAMGLAPAYADTSTAGAMVTTYSVPIAFEVHASGTVAANTTSTFNLSLPYTPSSNANVYLSYILTNASDGTELSDASGIEIKLTDTSGNTLSTISLSSGSPAKAVVPLDVSLPENFSVVITNPLASNVNANVTITVLDTAEFSVSVSPQSLSVEKGKTASVTVTITETSGPSGTIYLYPSVDDSAISTTITPSQYFIKPGTTLTATWSFTVGSGARAGSHQAKLVGDFQPSNVPGAGQTYTFAEILMPIATEAAAGAGGFTLGALAGASIGHWAVLIGLILLFVIIAAVLLK